MKELRTYNSWQMVMGMLGTTGMVSGVFNNFYGVIASIIALIVIGIFIQDSQKKLKKMKK